MKYAVIKNDSKQVKVQSGKSIWIDKIDAKVGEICSFDHIIALNDGEKLHIGHPKLNANVKGIVQKHGKGPKLIIFRTKAKSNWKRKQGHRQDYTRILITEISLNDVKIDTIKDKNINLEAIDGIEKEKNLKNITTPKPKQEKIEISQIKEKEINESLTIEDKESNDITE